MTELNFVTDSLCIAYVCTLLRYLTITAYSEL